ncbi:MAG: hypothetical protein J6Y02_09650 [Pseudobutyrivibrio sp.]|nr:hypothetical protein [Pseudobutyrivibrio sp.]
MADKSFGDILKTTIKYTIGIGMGLDFGQFFLKQIRKTEIKACESLINRLDKYTKKDEPETDISEEKTEES